MALTFGSLFTGIGGFDIGLERVGMVCKWQVEIDPYATAILERHWPNVERWRDVTDFTPNKNCKVDVICGGFPCQDISVAGKGEGLDGKRSGLWSEYARIVGSLRPRYVIVENVSAILARGRGIDRVCGELAEFGYDSEWQTFFASDFGLPHRRERILLIAYPHKNVRRKRKGMGAVEDWQTEVFGASRGERQQVRVEAADRFIGMDDGLSRRAYSHRACALGNAVVPAAAEWVGRKIIEHDQRIRGDTD